MYRLQTLTTILILLWLSLLPGLYSGAALLAEDNPETAAAAPLQTPPVNGPDLQLTEARVRYLPDLELLVFEQKVKGNVGATVPLARGELNGAPVLGYVFPTTLRPTDVGFQVENGEAEGGIVALAVTAHPDFDDTPLWDEDNDRDYGNDGAIYHTHWVVLEADARAPGGLAVRQISKTEIAQLLPPTNPGMPMLMDSPGFAVVLQGNTLRVLVPAQRANHQTDFRYDAVVAYMEVSTNPQQPMLGVYEVYGVLSGDLSLPYSVER